MEEFRGTAMKRVTGKEKAAWLASQILLLDKSFSLLLSAGPSNHEPKVYRFTIDGRMSSTFDRLANEYEETKGV